MSQPKASRATEPLSNACAAADLNYAHRNFLTRAYPTMKKNNPHIPILIREALGVEPKVWARYEYGKEQVKSLKGELGRELEKCKLSPHTY